MRGLDLGLRRFKFFPAEASGGVDMLRAFHGPFPDVRFCPTGGVTALNAPNYLALPNVACVGGSWIVPRGALDVGAVGRAARAAAALTRSGRESQQP
jgi:2-dehydro-3-deoxyphosphogluconate aldolase/(4S)-4-hydroxy-2-oxoglutarate aldolase